MPFQDFRDIFFVCLSLVDLIGAQSNNISEQNQPPPPQEHLPGNSF